MTADELRQLFARLAGEDVDAAIEVADELMAAGQPLAALVAIGKRKPADDTISRAVAAVEAKVADGELDPVAAGLLLWVTLTDESDVWRMLSASTDGWAFPTGGTAGTRTDRRPTRGCLPRG